MKHNFDPSPKSAINLMEDDTPGLREKIMLALAERRKRVVTIKDQFITDIVYIGQKKVYVNVRETRLGGKEQNVSLQLQWKYPTWVPASRWGTEIKIIIWSGNYRL